MPVSIHVPRINNNDDEVRLAELRIAVGEAVQAGQVVAAVETDKATVDVEAPSAGFVLAIQGEVDARLRVGSVLVWLGATADEAVPVQAASATGMASAGAGQAGRPTAKAMALLRQYGLAAEAVRASADRLSADDVLRHAQALGLQPRAAGAAAAPAPATASRPEVAGTARPLLSHERGMLHTVCWQRDSAVPGYLELACDHPAWERHAAEVGRAQQLLLNPLLPLMAWRLVQLAAASPRLNATIVQEQRLEYDSVNLGFTVQAGDVLYLAVVRDAAALDETAFVQRLVDLQRRAAAHKLEPQELSGATIGFSSMSRWKVNRHVPILSPHTALMVAHTVTPEGQCVLGATYDHRVLHGGEVAVLLRKLATPPSAA
ncbi:pyruvate/2-oxoglutarate dehydrogenase complex, dihydrolipoamide acyltransferase component [Burkholderiales bacterium JOSHI_001]|nr:pyruvate/2-oxoglutarate dehydrogenase complex, dihydrolipoamide acyltransferase component [Burkholderiales bacterium JOSHI_001]